MFGGMVFGGFLIHVLRRKSRRLSIFNVNKRYDHHTLATMSKENLLSLFPESLKDENLTKSEMIYILAKNRRKTMHHKDLKNASRKDKKGHRRHLNVMRMRYKGTKK